MKKKEEKENRGFLRAYSGASLDVMKFIAAILMVFDHLAYAGMISPAFHNSLGRGVFPVFAYMLQGTLTVEVENHKMLQFPANTSFSEVINTLHNGINNGKEDVILIAFFMGEKGKPLSVH